jgi:hypothetical protein
MNTLWQIAEQFASHGVVADVREYGNGNINDTYLVTSKDEDRFILQRINTAVFSRPELIVQNQIVLNKHVNARLQTGERASSRRWEVPTVRPTRFGKTHFIDAIGGFWRAISFISHSSSYDTIINHKHAREAGYALGRFQSLLSDLDIDLVHDTLEGFHITPTYLSQYDSITQRKPIFSASPKIQYCQDVIDARRSRVSVLEDAKEQGELLTRVIHGDPKINNFMICNRTGMAVSVVDLDTVKPGLVHYDIGDCLRSACNPLGEETTDYEQVHFDIELARSILEGYISVASEFLTDFDYAYMYDAIWLIPLELGLRFFMDFLVGSVYFKVEHETHNLERALVQFRLTESIEAQENEILALLKDILA